MPPADAERQRGFKARYLGLPLKKRSHDQAYELQSMLPISPLFKLHNAYRTRPSGVYTTAPISSYNI